MFAEKVSKVIAVDLMESFIQKNKEATAKFENVQHIVADVTKLKLEDQSYVCNLTPLYGAYFDANQI